MASSLTTSGFVPPFWPFKAGTAQVQGEISGSLFTNTNTFFNGEIPSVSTIEGGLFTDSDSLFHGSHRGPPLGKAIAQRQPT